MADKATNGGQSGLTMPNGHARQALCNVLDDLQGSPALDGCQNEDGAELNTLLQDEHKARLAAEAASQDRAQRLVVHAEQVAEYASQKVADLAQVHTDAKGLQAALEGLSAQLPPELLEAAQRLAALTGDTCSDALSFAEQTRHDAERVKRSEEAAGPEASPAAAAAAMETQAAAVQEDDDANERGEAKDMETEPAQAASSSSYRERAAYIPMRLELEDRRLFRLLEAALNVSEYTDKVDVLVWRRKDGRITQQIQDICSILSGLVVAQNYKRGQELIRNRDFKVNEKFFQVVFEIGRRYKIMNPDRMRSEYGKLLYMLMDASNPQIRELLEFSCIKPLLTVASFLEARNAIAVLDDPLMSVATAEIRAAGRPRHAVQQDIKEKDKARKQLAQKYCNSACSQDDVLSAIYSFSDNNSYLLFNRDPIDRMLTYLTETFSPRQCDSEFSLAISSGRNGARLSHNHERQYAYVLQSLMLWREIMTDMFRLWYLAEQDLLQEGSSYRLCDTGQGLNRVQPAPRVSKAMHQILNTCQRRVGSWVGSSVVHLGDHNVPNALMFIDKYTQVPRILNPVVRVLEELPSLVKDPAVALYIEKAFGGVDRCRMTILCDFFRHAFDGSGADNFFDAGSCIDGRLTSAWHWCSQLEKKSYYIVFKMAGFVGFDGDFK